MRMYGTLLTRLQVTQSFLVQVHVDPDDVPGQYPTSPVQEMVSLGIEEKLTAFERSVHVLSKRAAKARQPAKEAG